MIGKRGRVWTTTEAVNAALGLFQAGTQDVVIDINNELQLDDILSKLKAEDIEV